MPKYKITMKEIKIYDAIIEADTLEDAKNQIDSGDIIGWQEDEEAGWFELGHDHYISAGTDADGNDIWSQVTGRLEQA